MKLTQTAKHTVITVMSTKMFMPPQWKKHYVFTMSRGHAIGISFASQEYQEQTSMKSLTGYERIF